MSVTLCVAHWLLSAGLGVRWVSVLHKNKARTAKQAVGSVFWTMTEVKRGDWRGGGASKQLSVKLKAPLAAQRGGRECDPLRERRGRTLRGKASVRAGARLHHVPLQQGTRRIPLPAATAMETAVLLDAIGWPGPLRRRWPGRRRTAPLRTPRPPGGSSSSPLLCTPLLLPRWWGRLRREGPKCSSAGWRWAWTAQSCAAAAWPGPGGRRAGGTPERRRPPTGTRRTTSLRTRSAL